jgi:hypothetical protein
MDKPKGGRGVKAPYETTHIRVPVPLKDEVDALVSRYREQGDSQGNQSVLSVDEAIDQGRNILKQKKSAKISIEKLLTAIYRQTITLE